MECWTEPDISILVWCRGNVEMDKICGVCPLWYGHDGVVPKYPTKSHCPTKILILSKLWLVNCAHIASHFNASKDKALLELIL